MSEDKKIHVVMVEVSVEGCEDLDAANDYVAGWLNERALPRTQPRRILQVDVLTDHEVDNSNQRVFYAHPSDVDAEYDQEEYERELAREREEDENAG